MKVCLFDMLFLQMPEPSAETVKYEQERDMINNPHNDHYKPERRGRQEIIGDLKAENAREQLCRLAMAKLKHRKELDANGGFAEVGFVTSEEGE